MDLEDLHAHWNYAHDSGGGSDPTWCEPYIRYVSELIAEERPASVVDLGCGDFEVGGRIDYGPARVVCVDGSLRHVTAHAARWPQYEFINWDLEEFDAGGFDLGLMKDVLQHWPTDRIKKFLSRPLPRLMLFTNDTSGGEVNGDIQRRAMEDDHLQANVRGLDLTAEPFNLKGTVTLRLGGKDCLLVRR